MTDETTRNSAVLVIVKATVVASVILATLTAINWLAFGEFWLP